MAFIRGASSAKPLPIRKRATHRQARVALAKRPPGAGERAMVEIIWRDPAGNVCRKRQPWRAGNSITLVEWIEDYIERVRNGYRPKGFEVPPIPHCARIHYGGDVIQEWIMR